MTSPTREQRAAIEAPADAQMLVTAGPGTGKTYTLIARCLHLAEEFSEPVLVLSFTRAVVAEVRRRATDAGASIVARTIDGHAGAVLEAAGHGRGRSFNDTIRRATELLRQEGGGAAPHHVLVDEVQDLVQPRLSFVIEVLRRSTTGFSLFGDPRQAIYGFGARDARDALEVLREDFPDLQDRSLRKIHRRKVDRMLADAPDTVTGSVLIRAASPMSSVREAALVLRNPEANAVLLTRTNGEALVMASELARAGVTTTVRQGADDRMAPAWIAAFAAADPRAHWSRRRVLATAETLTDAPQPDEVWRVLRRVARDDDGVRLARLRAAVARPASYDDFAPATGQISTIHRAKGLEWDTVIVLAPRDAAEQLEDDDERVLFVAATRAVGELWRLARPQAELKGLALDRRSGRWLVQRGPKGRDPLKAEVRLGDVQTIVPFGGSDAPAVQLRLGRDCAAGDEIQLRPTGDTYELVHASGPIGCTTAAFRSMVPRRWSDSGRPLVGARLLDVRTAAGEAARGASVGLPETGLWLVPELMGLVGPGEEQRR